MRLSALIITFLLLAVACTDRPVTAGPDADVEIPAWVESVYPEPGATVPDLDAVVVDHAIATGEEDIRLVIDGTDVTTYAAFDAAQLRYDGGVGPVVLDGGDHWAEVQLVTLPVEGVDYTILDTFRWEFTVG